MKYLFTIIACLYMFSLNTPIKEQDVDLKLLCSGKWIMEYAIMYNQKTMFPSEEGEESWMIFHEDGKHEIMSFGDKFIGEWKNEKSDILLMSDNGGTIEQKVELLTKNELLLSYVIDGETEKLGLKKQD